MDVSVSMWRYVHICGHRHPQRPEAFDPLDLELQAWVLGTEFGFSARIVYALSQ